MAWLSLPYLKGSVTHVPGLFCYLCRRSVPTGEPAPAGTFWYPATVFATLTNEAYAGIASQRFRGRDGEEDDFIRVPNAYTPVVTPEIFDAASRRLDLMYLAPTTNSRLVHESKQSLREWGHLSADLVTRLASTPRPTSHQIQAGRELLEESYALEIAEQKAKVQEVLARRFVVETEGVHLILDDCFRIGFVIGWERSDLVKRPVEFFFEAPSSANLLICIGVAAPPFVPVSICIANPARIDSYPQRILRGKDAGRRAKVLKSVRSLTTLPRVVREAFLSEKTVAHGAFLRVAQQQPTLVLKKEIERNLGWSEQAVRKVFYELRAASAAMPEARNHQRVAITCPRCGETRHMAPGDARQRTPGVCGPCSRKKDKVLAVCRTCGAERYFYPSLMKILSEGLSSPCHGCSLAAGRAKRAAQRLVEHEAFKEKCDFLRHIALLVFRLMSAREGVYAEPTLWSRTRRRLPTLRWRDTATRVAQTLTIDCAPEFVARCSRFITAQDDHDRSGCSGPNALDGWS